MKGQTRTHLDTQEAHTNAMLKETTENETSHTAQWTKSKGADKKNLHPPTDRYSIHTHTHRKSCCETQTHKNLAQIPGI
jgi:hypothetical protein